VAADHFLAVLKALDCLHKSSPHCAALLIIVANCPETSGTVPELSALSRPANGQTWCQRHNCPSYQAMYWIILHLSM